MNPNATSLFKTRAFWLFLAAPGLVASGAAAQTVIDVGTYGINAVPAQQRDMRLPPVTVDVGGGYGANGFGVDGELNCGQLKVSAEYCISNGDFRCGASLEGTVFGCDVSATATFGPEGLTCGVNCTSGMFSVGGGCNPEQGWCGYASLTCGDVVAKGTCREGGEYGGSCTYRGVGIWGERDGNGQCTVGPCLEWPF